MSTALTTPVSPKKTLIFSCTENTRLCHTYSFSYILVPFVYLISILFSSGLRRLFAHQSALMSTRCILTQYRLPLLFPPLAQLPFYTSEWGFPCRSAIFACYKDRRQIVFETAPYCITLRWCPLFCKHNCFFLLNHIQGLMIYNYQESLLLVYSFSRKSRDMDSLQVHNLFCRQTEPPLH